MGTVIYPFNSLHGERLDYISTWAGCYMKFGVGLARCWLCWMEWREISVNLRIVNEVISRIYFTPLYQTRRKPQTWIVVLRNLFVLIWVIQSNRVSDLIYDWKPFKRSKFIDSSLTKSFFQVISEPKSCPKYHFLYKNFMKSSKQLCFVNLKANHLVEIVFNSFQIQHVRW